MKLLDLINKIIDIEFKIIDKDNNYIVNSFNYYKSKEEKIEIMKTQEFASVCFPYLDEFISKIDVLEIKLNKYKELEIKVDVNIWQETDVYEKKLKDIKNPQIIVVSNIKWDTDGDKKIFEKLPKEIILNFIDFYDCENEDNFQDKVSNYISDLTGYCHDGFNFIIKSKNN